MPRGAVGVTCDAQASAGSSPLALGAAVTLAAPRRGPGCSGDCGPRPWRSRRCCWPSRRRRHRWPRAPADAALGGAAVVIAVIARGDGVAFSPPGPHRRPRGLGRRGGPARRIRRLAGRARRAAVLVFTVRRSMWVLGIVASSTRPAAPSPSSRSRGAPAVLARRARRPRPPAVDDRGPGRAGRHACGARRRARRRPDARGARPSRTRRCARRASWRAATAPRISLTSSTAPARCCGRPASRSGDASTRCRAPGTRRRLGRPRERHQRAPALERERRRDRPTPTASCGSQRRRHPLNGSADGSGLRGLRERLRRSAPRSPRIRRRRPLGRRRRLPGTGPLSATHRSAGVMIRILLADDEHLIRTALAQMLDLEDDISVVAEAADGDRAVALAGSAPPRRRRARPADAGAGRHRRRRAARSSFPAAAASSSPATAGPGTSNARWPPASAGSCRRPRPR